MTETGPRGSYACACGAKKDFYSKRCWTCWAALRAPDPTRKAQYRKEHQEQINEYHRKWSAANPERRRTYHRNYMARYRAEKREAHFDACPLCEGRKARTRELCKRCSTGQSARGEARVTSPGILICWACDVPLRKALWHEQEFLRCPTCGLEIKKAPMYVKEAIAA